jgi:acyl-CoA synthetase (AMP-forming)/AMP-acid ligase II
VTLDANLEVALSWRGAARFLGPGRAGNGYRDTLGPLPTNRPEFHVADAAALLLGAAPLSMYNSSAPEQLAHLVVDAGCRVAVTEPELLERLLAAIDLCPGIVDDVVVESRSWWGLLTSRRMRPVAQSRSPFTCPDRGVRCPAPAGQDDHTDLRLSLMKTAVRAFTNRRSGRKPHDGPRHSYRHRSGTSGACG